jgi:hypothetical protein
LQISPAGLGCLGLNGKKLIFAISLIYVIGMSALLEGLQYKGVILFLNLQLKYQCPEWR